MTSEYIYDLLGKIRAEQKLNAKWHFILGLLVALLGLFLTFFTSYVLNFGIVVLGLGVGYAINGRRLKKNTEIEKIMELLKNLN